MDKIRNWFKKRREAETKRYFEKIRALPADKKEEWLHNALMAAYYPLYMAMVGLEAPNFVQGDIIEQTTWEKFHIEIRRIKKEEPKP